MITDLYRELGRHAVRTSEIYLTLSPNGVCIPVNGPAPGCHSQIDIKIPAVDAAGV